MKRIIWGICMAVLLVSACDSTVQDPYQSAVENAIKAKNPDIKNLYISEFTLIDSVNCAAEIERCADVFRTKRDALATSAYNYRNQNKPKNAALKEEAAIQAEAVMNALLALKDVHSDCLDSTLYYCFRLAGDYSAQSGGHRSFTDWYATVGTDFRIYNIQQGKKGLLKGMGVSLPWYEETVKGFGTEAEAQL